ncbi:Rieske [2Fe-2S] iron-sulfur domain-containing protein [Aspergillus venezuelensis]
MLETLISALLALLAGLVYLYLSRPRALTNTSTFAFFDKALSTNTLEKAAPKSTLNTEPETVSKDPDIPNHWLTSHRIFELEKRAVFSKTWTPLALTSRFTNAKPGTYLTLNLATTPLILIKGKDHIIRGFHNVCRHRAYPVTTRESGCSTVLSCRYHGWSYNARGELIRAPQFEGVDGFENGGNGLFPVDVKVQGGIVWGCLAGNDMSMEEGGEEESERLEKIGIGMYTTWIGGGTMEGKFNWKIALNPAFITKALRLDVTKTPPAAPIVQRILNLIRRSSTQATEPLYLFPNTILLPLPNSNCLLTLSLWPLSATTTSVRYDLYATSSAQKKDETLLVFEKNIKALISELEGEHNSQPHTDLITPTQMNILGLLRAHTKLEKKEGKEINPAEREMRKNERYEAAENLCAELEMDCAGGKGESLSW